MKTKISLASLVILLLLPLTYATTQTIVAANPTITTEAQTNPTSYQGLPINLDKLNPSYLNIPTKVEPTLLQIILNGKTTSMTIELSEVDMNQKLTILTINKQRMKFIIGNAVPLTTDLGPIYLTVYNAYQDSNGQFVANMMMTTNQKPIPKPIDPIQTNLVIKIDDGGHSILLTSEDFKEAIFVVNGEETKGQLGVSYDMQNKQGTYLIGQHKIVLADTNYYDSQWQTNPKSWTAIKIGNNIVYASAGPSTVELYYDKPEIVLNLRTKIPTAQQYYTGLSYILFEGKTSDGTPALSFVIRSEGGYYQYDFSPALNLDEKQGIGYTTMTVTNLNTKQSTITDYQLKVGESIKLENGLTLDVSTIKDQGCGFVSFSLVTEKKIDAKTIYGESSSSVVTNDGCVIHHNSGVTDPVYQTETPIIDLTSYNAMATSFIIGELTNVGFSINGKITKTQIGVYDYDTTTQTATLYISEENKDQKYRLEAWNYQTRSPTVASLWQPITIGSTEIYALLGPKQGYDADSTQKEMAVIEFRTSLKDLNSVKPEQKYDYKIDLTSIGTTKIMTPSTLAIWDGKEFYYTTLKTASSNEQSIRLKVEGKDIELSLNKPYFLGSMNSLGFYLTLIETRGEKAALDFTVKYADKSEPSEQVLDVQTMRKEVEQLRADLDKTRKELVQTQEDLKRTNEEVSVLKKIIDRIKSWFG